MPKDAVRVRIFPSSVEEGVLNEFLRGVDFVEIRTPEYTVLSSDDGTIGGRRFPRTDFRYVIVYRVYPDEWATKDL